MELWKALDYKELGSAFGYPQLGSALATKESASEMQMVKIVGHIFALSGIYDLTLPHGEKHSYVIIEKYPPVSTPRVPPCMETIVQLGPSPNPKLKS